MRFILSLFCILWASLCCAGQGMYPIPMTYQTAAAPTCSDGIQNGDETGLDCGGSCDPCGGGSIAFVAADGDAATSTSDVSLSVTLTGSTGDCFICTGAVDAKVLSAPAGFTQIAETTTFITTTTWFKKSDGTETSLDFSVSGTYGYPVVGCVQYSGVKCDASGDFTIVTGGNASNDPDAECPDITTPSDNAVVLWIESGGEDFTANSIDRGAAVERVDVSSGSSYHVGMYTEDIATAGLVTGATITRSGWSGSGTASIALKLP